MISSTALNVPRRGDSTHSINTVGLAGARKSGSHDWSSYVYPPSQAVYATTASAADKEDDTERHESYNLENLLLLR